MTRGGVLGACLGLWILTTLLHAALFDAAVVVAGWLR